MNPYSIVLGLTALLLVHAAWRECRAGTPRDAWPLGLSGAAMGALAGVFPFLF